MKLTYGLVFFLFFISARGMAQHKLSNAQIDSLLKVNSSFIHQRPNESFELAKKTYLAAKQNKYDLGAAMSLHKISLYHLEILNDYKKALSYNDQGYEIAKKINNDSLLLFFSFERGVLYGKLGFNEKADKIFDDCLKKTKSIENSKKKSLFRGDLFTYKAVFQSRMKPIPDAKIILELYVKAMNEYEQALDQCINPGYTNVGVYYLELKEYDKATFYLKKAIEFFKQKNIVTCEVEYSNLSDLNYKTGQYEIALRYSDSSNAICLKKPHENYYLISVNFEGYKNIYAALGQKDSVAKYQNLELIYKDSLNLQSKNQLGESVDYMMSKSEGENQNLEKNLRIIIWGAVVGILMIGLLLTYYFRRRNTVLKNQTSIKEKDLEKDLDQKTTEIQQLKQKVITSYDELIIMAKKDNPLFVSFFKELYPDFYRKLKEIQPGLTILEQKVCFYLKLKFSTREIAECTFVSVKAIQTRKNRLRKRLFIEDGKDIYDWIDQLE